MSETHGKIVAKDGHVYHKSKTANATVAPTNEATIKKAQGGHLLPEHLQFITIVDYEWNLNSELNPESISEAYGYTSDEVRAYLQDEQVVQALSERGITDKLIDAVVDLAPATKTAKLTPIQLVAANNLLDLNDTRSNRKKLQDLGVTSTQYQAWLRDPEFTGYMQQRAESMLGDTQHEAMLALMDRVNARDMSAIKYYHELTGRYVAQSSTQQSSNAVDLQGMIVRIIEIIIDEVDDAQTALRISDRLNGLVTGARVAGILPSAAVGPEAIESPEIAKAREITPEVKQLMEQGVGYE